MSKTATYSLIASTTGTGSSNTISFTSIPATFTDLVFVFEGAATSGGTASLDIIFNNVTSGNLYSNTRVQGNGTTASSSRNTSGNTGTTGYISSSNRSMSIINIMDYANTSTYKTAITRTMTMDASDGRVGAYVNLFQSTSAINRVDLSATANFATTSVFKLYGIQAGNA